MTSARAACLKTEECLGVTVQLGDIERFLYYDYTKRLNPSRPSRGVLNWGVFGVELRDFGAEKEWSCCVEINFILIFTLRWAKKTMDRRYSKRFSTEKIFLWYGRVKFNRLRNKILWRLPIRFMDQIWRLYFPWNS